MISAKRLQVALLMVGAGAQVAAAQALFAPMPAGQPRAVNMMGTVVLSTGYRYRDSDGAVLFGGQLTDVSEDDLVMIRTDGRWRDGTWTLLEGFAFNPCPEWNCEIVRTTGYPKSCDATGATVMGDVGRLQQGRSPALWNYVGDVIYGNSGPCLTCSTSGLAISGDGRTLATLDGASPGTGGTLRTTNLANGFTRTMQGVVTSFGGMTNNGGRVAHVASQHGIVEFNGVRVLDSSGTDIVLPNDLTLTVMSEDGRWIVARSTGVKVRKPDGLFVDLKEHLLARGETSVAGWTLTNATAIAHDASYVVGVGIGPDGVTRSWRANLCDVPSHFQIVSTSATDPRRWQHTVAWNTKAAAFIRFGGRSESNVFTNQTHRWTGSAWTPVTTVVAPAGRADHAMASDYLGNTYVFGGQTATAQLLGDFWKFDGAVWSQVQATGTPPATGGHALTYDAARNRVVMSGGFRNTDSGLVCTEDTYEFDPISGTWSLRSSTGPQARFAHAMAYDPLRKLTVVFGGYGNTSAYLGDTWAWDGTQWMQLVGPGPEARHYHSMQWDPTRRGIVLTGGRNASGVLSDQWLLTSAGWQRLSEPYAGGGVWAHAAATSPLGQMLIAGGATSDGAIRGDTLVSSKAPRIVMQPPAAIVASGQTIQLTVGAVGSWLEYQWEREGVMLQDGPGVSGANAATLVLSGLQSADAGLYRVRVTNCAGGVTSTAVRVDVIACDSIDFNNNGVFPEDQDVVDFFGVLAGGECAGCNDIDFNNNGVFPEDQDVVDFFNVLAGGVCPS